MNSLKIFVCAHKKDACIRCDYPYVPIQVGKSVSQVDLGFCGDDTGENISDRNRKYSELTAQYWAWKNLKDIDYIGFAHYRRYFKMDISLDNIETILRKKDIIVVKPSIHYYNNALEFQRLVSLEDLYILLDTLLEMYPQYEESIISYLYLSNEWIPCNMFIAKKEVFNQYCDFLFPLLFKVEDRLKSYNYSRLNRSLGYMGELLLGLYCVHNGLKMKYVRMDLLGVQSNKVKMLIGHIRHSLAFLLSKQYGLKSIPIYQSVIAGLKQDGLKLPYLLKAGDK